MSERWKSSYDLWIGLDVYFHHEHETENNYIKKMVAMRLICAVTSEKLFEARTWNEDGERK